MRKMLLILTGVVCIVAVTVMTSPARAQGCGPGPHWIDDCAAGEDNMPNTRALVGVDLNNDCNDVELNLILCGPVTVERLDPSDDSNRFPGTRPVDGHLDVIDTEILSMSLLNDDGYILVAGAGQGQGGVLDHSYGVIAELPDDSLGESFFDVFFEIYVPGFDMYLYNHESCSIATVIDSIPPFGARYINPPGLCLPLYTDPIGGDSVANLVTAEHQIIDCSFIPTLNEWGMIILALLLLAFGTVAVVRRRKAILSRSV